MAGKPVFVYFANFSPALTFDSDVGADLAAKFADYCAVPDPAARAHQIGYLNDSGNHGNITIDLAAVVAVQVES